MWRGRRPGRSGSSFTSTATAVRLRGAGAPRGGFGLHGARTDRGYAELGTRERDVRNGFGLPPHLRMANFEDDSDLSAIHQ